MCDITAYCLAQPCFLHGQSWTFCWGTGFCNLMARVPDSVIKTEGGKPTYNPKCASGIVKGEGAVACTWVAP